MTFTANPTAVGDGQQIIWQWYNGGSPITTAAITTEATGSTSDKLLFKTSFGASIATSLDLTYTVATFSGSISSLGESYRSTSTFTYAAGVAATHRTALGLTTLATTTPAANVATFLETPSSANLAAAVTDETGTGSLVFGTSPTLTTPTIAAINGGTAANDDITIQGTTNATRTTSYVNLQPNGGLVGIGISTPVSPLHPFGTSANASLSANTGILTVEGSVTNQISIGLMSTTPFGAYIQVKNKINNGSTVYPLSLNPLGGGVGIGTSTPNTAASLDVTSTTQGFLPPRMTTTQRNAIASVPAGLMVYNTTTNKLNFYNGSAWEAVTSL
jgi:hypothetical protein